MKLIKSEKQANSLVELQFSVDAETFKAAVDKAFKRECKKYNVPGFRRRKEIAIRKVNGAKVKDILRIFLKDIMKIALPCIIVGDLGAWLIARQWLMSFSEKITMTPLLFIGVTIILLVIIGLSVIINCYKVANSNPVKYLKDE